MNLIDKEFLLTNETGKLLFHNYAEKMPIIDYHCHLDSKTIYENKNYSNLSQIWINDGNFGDHYKWRLMRANGISEELITGEGDDYQKLVAWASTIEKAIGNPLYEWTHLELQRFFNVTEPFSTKNVKQIWDKANALLATNSFKPRSLIQNSNVKVICTTDDPASDLKYHQLLKNEEVTNGFKVLPAMRPDKLLNIQDEDYNKYLEKLSISAGIVIKDFSTLINALKQRFKFFNKLGGRLSDHGLNTFYYVSVDEKTLNKIVNKGRNNQPLNVQEVNAYLTAIIKALMKLNKQFSWTMQFHINVIRSANKPMLQKLGADTGFDSIGTQANITDELMKLFISMQKENTIPKTIFYSLNPNDWLQLATGMGDFYGDGIRQKLQLGAAWWFNDTREGIQEQLRIMSEQSLLANFVGMLTDSRSFLSYPRHEYFRRILCDYIGGLVERGQAPNDTAYLGKIVEDIAYNNAHDYFGFFK